jgi:hypothetical protein
MHHTKNEVTLIITYRDGTHDEFRFPHQGDSSRMVNLVSQIMASKILAFQLEDRLLAIPADNIRSVEVLPAPANLPEFVITDARRVKEAV